MKALVKTGENQAEVKEVEKPNEKTLVKTLRVGIDGTDREVLEEDHSIIPPGDDDMIMGHEAIGRVVKSSGEIGEGTLVVPTVRRASDTCPPRFQDRADFCAPGRYVERGIYQAHGFCSEYFAEDPEHLVTVPKEIESIGVLVEPTSIVVKALEQGLKAQERLDFQPESAVVLGAGSIGLLASMILRRKGVKVKTVDIVDEDHPKVRILNLMGADYVDNRETDLEELDSPDLILESSGVSEQLFEALDLLGSNGALISVGLPRDEKAEKKVEIGKIHQEMVLKNKLFIGSVNSSVTHFKQAIDHLKYFKDNYPVKEILDTETDLENWKEAFQPTIKGEIVFE